MSAATLAPVPFERPTAGLSRRATLRGVVGAGLTGLGLATGARASAAQAPTSLPPPFAAWLAVWNGDLARADTLYAEDVILEDVAAGLSFEGRDTVKGHLAELAASFPDHTYELRSTIVAGNRTAAEFRWTATYAATLAGLPPATGQRVILRGVVVIELSGDTIQRESHYYDVYAFLVQLGALPVPPAEGAAEATPSS